MSAKIGFVDDLRYGEVRPKGIFELKVLKSGVIIREYVKNNLVVDSAFFQMARLLAGDVTGRSITKIGFGTGGSDPDPADTVLTDQYLRTVTGYEYPENNQVKVLWVLPADECNGIAIREFGLFTTDGTMFSRIALDEAIPKQSTFSFEGSWIINF